jgi:flagellar hook protein FlgE
MASFYIPLSGLNADSTALNTIANNLSNMNTTAFKTQTTNFSDMFYQQVGTAGSGNEIQQGEGVQVASNSIDFTQGGYDTSGTTTSDVALDGNGFFVVSDGSSNLYTRDGSFTQASNGNLVTAGGLSVMGYPAVDGVVNTNAPLTAINIPANGAEQAATATTSFTMTANLDSATGTTLPGTVTLYDSLGTAHTATITYTQTGTNTWSYSAALPAADFTSGTSTPITGTLTFDSSGNLSQVTQTTPTAVAATTVGMASGDISSIPLSFTGLADGAADLSNVSWNLLGTSGKPTISQEATASTETASSPNGNPAGVCTGFTISSDGTVSATYSSGTTSAVGQLALANVTNQQGLSLQGSGDYATTLASGSASVGTAGSGGLGTVQDSTLEESNVNISAEFSDLIIAQRGFEANSKAITTFDTITQETINMIH